MLTAVACAIPKIPRGVGRRQPMGTSLQQTADRSTRPVIPGYTSRMKTAISLPDETYEQATRQAAELGISRSEFFARAARRYLDDLAEESLTQQIDEALDAAGPDDSGVEAVAAGRDRLAAEDDW
jgi:Ribbon-helix-helix protein, copG family